MAADQVAGHELERRTVLFGAGAVGIAGVLVACGGDSADDEPQSTPTGRTDDEPTDEPNADQGDDQSDDQGEGEPDDAGAPLVAASDVPVGGGVVLPDEQVVVTQPSEGEFLGFSAICTHQGCTVASVDDGEIRCPCHGSRYSIEDGTVVNGPATQPLPEVAVSVQGDEIVRA